jgi:hypothetical protein
VARALPVDRTLLVRIEAAGAAGGGDARLEELVQYARLARGLEAGSPWPLSRRLPHRVFGLVLASRPGPQNSRDLAERARVADRAVLLAPWYFPAARMLAASLQQGLRDQEAAQVLRNFLDRAPLTPPAREEFERRLAQSLGHLEASPR